MSLGKPPQSALRRPASPQFRRVRARGAAEETPPPASARSRIAAKPRTVIDARRRGRISFGELWRFREVLYHLVLRNVKLRYKQTFFGIAWALLQPGVMALAFTIFVRGLHREGHSGLPYPLFAYSGLTLWLLFAGGLGQAAGSVVGSQHLITKIYFPRLFIPWAAIAVGVIDWIVATVCVVPVTIYLGLPLSSQCWAVPLAGLVAAAAACALGTLLASLNVIYRDFQNIVPFLIQVFMFATPAIYLDLPRGATADSWSELIAWISAVNPLAAAIHFQRAALFGGALPWGELGRAAVAVTILLVLVSWYFVWAEERFPDVV
ncbi:MAG: ABC transporter permease [Planctomycetota bacterium]